jgi:processive 1,2-diacylglycerol beta-glucosyltransferase
MKKILIYSSIGGGGHESARKAITAYLEHDYDISYEHMFDTTLAPMDLIHYITFKNYSGVRMYNYFVQRKFFRLINLSYYLGRKYIHFFNKLINRNIKKSVIKHKPDLVISVIPIVNNAILAITKQMNIPLIIIPTDLDVNTFVFGLKGPYPKNFRFILAFKNNGIESTICQADIPNEQKIIGGFPIRPEFFTPKNRDAIKQKYNLPNNKPIILLLMGAAGSIGSYEYAKYIAQIKQPMHLIVVLGRDKQLRSKIKKINFPDYITITIFDFIEEMADLMAVSDICITKSGTVSVMETIYSDLPVLLDATNNVLAWEQFNHDFIRRNNFGESIFLYKNIAEKVSYYISHPEQIKKIKENIASFEKKNLGIEIKKIIEKLLE